LSLNRSEKEAVISEVTGLAAKAQTLVMAEYRGITVADMTKLRSACTQQWREPECVEKHLGPPCCGR
jgi:large subunit ribosomal protein L10